MLRILDVFLLQNKTHQFQYESYKNINFEFASDNWEYNNFVISIDKDNTLRALIFGIYEKNGVKLLVEMFCVITKYREIFPILVKYMDLNQKKLYYNDLLVIENIKTLIQVKLIEYRECFSNISLNVGNIFDLLIPDEHKEFIKYKNDPIYSNFTRFSMDTSYDEIRAALEGVMMRSYDRFNKFNLNNNLNCQFENILYNTDIRWSESFIKEFKSTFLNINLISSLVSRHNKKHITSTPPLAFTPIATDETLISHDIFDDLSVCRYLLFSHITDFHITFNFENGKSYIENIYSAIHFKTISKSYVDRFVMTFSKLIMNWVKRINIPNNDAIVNKRIPDSGNILSIEIQKNFFGNMSVRVKLAGGYIRYFYSDIYFISFIGEGIEVTE